MTEQSRMFRAIQTVNVNGFAKTYEFAIDKGTTTSNYPQRISLVIRKDVNRILDITVEKFLIRDPNEGDTYKYVVKVDGEGSDAGLKIMAEVTCKCEFSWFSVPEDNLASFVRERGVEALANEFIGNLFAFLSGNIPLKKKQ